MDSQQSDGVPPTIGGCSIHLTGELARTSEIDDVSRLGKDLRSWHVLAAFHVDVNPVPLDRVQQPRVLRPIDFGSCVHERGDRIAESSPDTRSDPAHRVLGLRPLRGCAHLQEEVYVAVRPAFSSSHGSEEPDLLGPRRRDGFGHLALQLRPKSCLSSEEVRQSCEQNMRGIQLPGVGPSDNFAENERSVRELAQVTGRLGGRHARRSCQFTPRPSTVGRAVHGPEQSQLGGRTKYGVQGLLYPLYRLRYIQL